MDNLESNTLILNNSRITGNQVPLNLRNFIEKNEINSNLILLKNLFTAKSTKKIFSLTTKPKIKANDEKILTLKQASKTYKQNL